MKKNGVKLHEVYAAKVSGEVVPVRLDKESPHGGWDGTNLRTKKQVRIRTAGRLRGLWPKKHLPVAGTPAPAGDAEAKPDEVAKATMARNHARKAAEADAKAAGPDATGANVGAPGATPKATKAAKAATKKDAKPPRRSLLNLAAGVLKAFGEPMDCKAIVDRVLEQGLWQTKGKTPAATLYSAIIREIAAKGTKARFRKVERGKFALAAK